MKLFKEKNAKPQYMESRRSSGISGLVMFAVIVIAAIFVMSISFRVKDIRVSGNEHYTDSEIINAIDIEEGDNLFFFDRFAAISRVNRMHLVHIQLPLLSLRLRKMDIQTYLLLKLLLKEYLRLKGVLVLSFLKTANYK